VDVPSFCRHNRFIDNCPICSPKVAPPKRAAKPASGSAAAPRADRATSSGSSTRRAGTSSAVRVRKLTRAVEDGYSSPLVPGLKASADAEQLAEELGFAVGRLEELTDAPSGLYAEAGSATDRDEALWLATQIVLLGPAEGADDPFEALRGVVVDWAGGSLPDLDGFTLGPRSPFADATAAARGLASFRAWAGRAGSLHAAFEGDEVWTAERRFERIFERLGTVTGLGRARYDVLLVAGALGLVPLQATSLIAGDRDDATAAAKRIFGIGDRLLLDRRADELARAAEVPIAAFDLALANFGRPANRVRYLIGATEAAADPAARDRALSALKLG
jgi:hypothetical protein